MQLLSIKQVAQRTTLSRSVINLKRVTGEFPTAVRLGQKRIAFVEAEVDAWIRERVDARAKGGCDA